MPSLRDIEEFADELKRLGNEPEILRRRGEAQPTGRARPAQPPSAPLQEEEVEEGLPPDIDQLLAGLGEEPIAEATEQPAGEPPAGGQEVEGPAAEVPESGAAEQEAGGTPEDFFIDDFLRRSAEAEESELTSIGESEDSLFFQVPSAEELAPPEGFEGPEEEAPFPEVPREPEAVSGEVEAEPQGQAEPLEAAELEEAAGSEAPPGRVQRAAPVPLGEAAGEGEPVGAGEIEGAELPEGLELPEDFSFEAEAPSIGAEELGEAALEELYPPGEERPGEGPEGFADFGILEPRGGPAPSEEEPTGGAPTAPSEGGGESADAEELEQVASFPEEEIPTEEALFEAPEFELPGEEPAFEGGGGGETAPAAESAAAPAGIEDIGLDDIGAQFGFGQGEEGAPSEEELNPAVAIGQSTPEPPKAGGAPPRPPSGETPSLHLSNRDFDRVQQTLSSLPRNLRIIVEELIGEQELAGPELERLVGLLVRGAAPSEIAQAAGQIAGRRIRIPASYAKRSGLAFEEERATFAYRFRHNILPILRVFLGAAAVLAVLVFLGYRFVYRPIHAYVLYATGYSQLEADNFMTANQEFDRASRSWQMKGWYYRYADGYIQKRQYSFAVQKYEALLRLWPGDRKGVFDFAAMESRVLGDYAKANQLLNIILGRNMWDYQGLLRAGDNYLRWGAEDPTKYELARQDFAMLLQHYGRSNTVLFRMLRYFILTDNLKQVEILKNYFQADPRITVDPVAYAQLGGYLIDKNRLSDVHSILFRALKVDPKLPETNYNLARYFKKIGDYGQEAVALQRTLDFLLASVPLTSARLGMLISTYDLIGENLYRQKRYLDAQAAYTKGIDRYEAALRQNQLRPSPEFGKLYADLGDVNYYVGGNYNEALRLYLKAEENGYITPELRYKEGYVYYRNQDYRQALLKFYNAAGSFSDNWDLIYATANTLYQRNDYFAAEGYYLNLLNTLEEQRRSISDFQPSVVPAQHDLLVNLMKVYNNLGVTLNQLSKRSSDPTNYSESLVNLTRSMEAYDQLTRNPTTLVAPPSINLAFINTKSILYPTPNYDLQIYADIPQNMNVKSF